MWFVYVAECVDKSLYCGITTDVSRRIHEHNFTKRSAKYTRSRRPVKLVYCSDGMTRSRAASVESTFKKLPTQRKRKIVYGELSFDDFIEFVPGR
jgi:putative endonuclease